jgi:iron complex outermembrane receptor protein
MSVAAYAQSGPPETLEEVIVTAQKREQDVRDVPSSVETLRDEDLDAMTAAGADVRLLSARVPSLYVESSFGRTFPRFYIRGLGNTDFDLNASQPVSLIYDEVVLESPILKGFPAFDLDRIEVLRGPQGTLFGRNTPAGIVKFESRKPTYETEGFGRLSWGRYNQTQFEGAVGGPLSKDVVAGRASILYQGRSDWVDNSFTGKDNELEGYQEFAGRAQLLLTPGNEFSALLNVHGRDLDGTARVFQGNMIKSGTDEIRDGFDREKVFHDAANSQEVKTIGGVAKLDYEFEPVTLTSVTGYESAEIFSRGDIDGGFGGAFTPPSGPNGPVAFASETADAIPDMDQFTQEIRVASNGWVKTNFQAGFFYFWEDLNIESFSYDTTVPGSPQNGFATQKQETNAWALFGTVDFDATSQLRLSGGVRYSDDEKKFSAERTQDPLPGFLGGVGPLPEVTRNPSDSEVSWDVSALYAANEDVNVYGRVAKGFRAPSIQGRLLFADSLFLANSDTVSVANTEKILSYEIGVKTNLMGSRARTNVSVFYYTMDDQQLTAVGGATNVNTLLNADKTTGAGFEADLEYLATPQLLLTAGLSYNKTEIDDPNLGTVPGNADSLTVLDPPIETGSSVVSINGNSLPNAPEWVINATARYGLPIGSAGEGFLHTDWAYRSKVQFFLYESEEFQDAYLVEGGSPERAESTSTT